jgi:hypothetical protein
MEKHRCFLVFHFKEDFPPYVFWKRPKQPHICDCEKRADLTLVMCFIVGVLLYWSTCRVPYKLTTPVPRRGRRFARGTCRFTEETNEPNARRWCLLYVLWIIIWNCKPSADEMGLQICLSIVCISNWYISYTVRMCCIYISLMWGKQNLDEKSKTFGNTINVYVYYTKLDNTTIVSMIQVNEMEHHHFKATQTAYS